jgi:hypothetical protein
MAQGNFQDFSDCGAKLQFGIESMVVARTALPKVGTARRAVQAVSPKPPYLGRKSPVGHFSAHPVGGAALIYPQDLWINTGKSNFQQD